jgi:hypothetical protein
MIFSLFQIPLFPARILNLALSRSRSGDARVQIAGSDQVSERIFAIAYDPDDGGVGARRHPQPLPTSRS